MPSSIDVLRGLRILIAEDEALVALDLQTVLEASGAAVVGPCRTFSRAMRVVRSGDRLDGAVLDVELGAHDTLPVADLLAARGVPFVFHTGRDDIDRLHERYEDAPVLLKPNRPEDVADQLAGAIAGRIRRRAP